MLFHQTVYNIAMTLNSKLNTVLTIFAIFSIDISHSHIRQNEKKNNIAEKFVKIERRESETECWMQLDSKKHFDAMDQLEKRYAEVRKEYQNVVKDDNFDDQMLMAMILTRGAAEREVQKVGGDLGLIPAGINLGGYCMMRMPNSVIFFHRMKLRNNTRFQVTQLRNDLENMVLQAAISLNDLHLLGSYDRSITDKDPSILYYTPAYGQVEFLLKNVQYNMEGRYRLLKDRLTIELIISNITFDDVMMTYLNNENNGPTRLDKKNIEEFLDRLKIDLDKWLKDYFNDYLMYFGIVGNKASNRFQQYHKERTIQLNDYIDDVIKNLVTRKLHKTNTGSVVLPKFKIFTVNGMELYLKHGVLRGLDSIYRRSVATSRKEKDIRKVDAVVGFSDLKVVYKYEAWLSSNTPSLRGTMIFSADELTARMEVAIVESGTVDLKFEFLEQAKPESLTIEGSANRVISNFKYLIEQHVIALMTNSIIYNIKLLGSVTRCVPSLIGDPNVTPGSNNNSMSEGEVGNTSTEDSVGQESDIHI